MSENSFVERATSIVIPPDIKPTDALRITSEIDALLNEMFTHYLSSKQKFKNIEDQVYRTIRVQKSIIKQNNPKMSNDLVDTTAFKSIEETGMFKELDEAREQFIYYDEIFHFLKSKKESLISDSAFLKMELSFKD